MEGEVVKVVTSSAVKVSPGTSGKKTYVGGGVTTVSNVAAVSDIIESDIK